MVGPSIGGDNAVVRIQRQNVLVCTTDPLSFVPSLGAKDSAWLSVHLIASDIATSGFGPQYGIFNFNLPPVMPDPLFVEYWRALHKECKRLGIAIVAGHTGKYEGCNYTIIGSGVMMVVCPTSQFLTSSMGGNGDDLILTKGAAIETTAVLTRSFKRKVRRLLGPELFGNAWGYLRKVTTVEDSLTAYSAGPARHAVTAMHDATEGGVLAAAIEMAEASGLGLKLELDRIQISPETREVCKLFRIDPLVALSEGSLLIASKPSATSNILNELKSKGISSSVVGSLVHRKKGFHGIGSKGSFRLSYPKRDPYWEAYSKAAARGWA